MYQTYHNSVPPEKQLKVHDLLQAQTGMPSFYLGKGAASWLQGQGTQMPVRFPVNCAGRRPHSVLTPGCAEGVWRKPSDTKDC